MPSRRREGMIVACPPRIASSSPVAREGASAARPRPTSRSGAAACSIASWPVSARSSPDGSPRWRPTRSMFRLECSELWRILQRGVRSPGSTRGSRRSARRRPRLVRRRLRPTRRGARRVRPRLRTGPRESRRPRRETWFSFSPSTRRRRGPWRRGWLQPPAAATAPSSSAGSRPFASAFRRSIESKPCGLRLRRPEVLGTRACVGRWPAWTSPKFRPRPTNAATSTRRRTCRGGQKPSARPTRALRSEARAL